MPGRRGLCRGAGPALTPLPGREPGPPTVRRRRGLLGTSRPGAVGAGLAPAILLMSALPVRVQGNGIVTSCVEKQPVFAHVSFPPPQQFSSFYFVCVESHNFWLVITQAGNIHSCKGNARPAGFGRPEGLARPEASGPGGRADAWPAFAGRGGPTPGAPRASQARRLLALQGLPPLSPEKPALCAGCGGKISDRYYLLAVDKQWHLRCLKCCECKLALESELTCFAKDGSIYCKEDYYRYSRVRPTRRGPRPLRPSAARFSGPRPGGPVHLARAVEGRQVPRALRSSPAATWGNPERAANVSPATEAEAGFVPFATNWAASVRWNGTGGRAAAPGGRVSGGWRETR